jgi:nicotinate dehydrogenase subunit B
MVGRGRPIDTPFGTVYSSNVTPDAEAGGWPEPTAAAIAQAIVSATGRRIPELPFTRVRVKTAIGV